jgi:hypothetical protein
MVDHSETFITGLQIIREEQRVPLRINVAISALEGDVEELSDLLAEDRFGSYTGFWRVWEIFRDHPKKELDKIVGTKLQRLDIWRRFLKEVGRSGKLVLPTPTFKEPQLVEIDYSLESLQKKMTLPLQSMKMD